MYQPISRRASFARRILSAFIAFTFIFASVLPPSYAQTISGLNLPIPGTMVNLSPAFVPVLLKGMTIHPDNPLQFDFIVDSGNTKFNTDEIKSESERLVKYFLASMTIPKDDLWVNLSPAEKDRIIPDELGKTELGRDMLAQDYILKQLTATLMYPEKELGKKFWDKIYKEAKEKFGTTEIPVNTFNKVWILPETATVYEHETTVYIVEAKLKVMLDSDYLAASHQPSKNLTTDDGRLTTQIIKEIILPAIEKEVNEGQNFASLRQIYHSLILAKWYKETVKNSLLSKLYIDQKKIAGVNIDDVTIKDQIYDQYMQAYKKGVFNYIKEDYDKLSNEVIPRKYFSGGEQLTNLNLTKLNKTTNPKTVSSAIVGSTFILKTNAEPQKNNSSSPLALWWSTEWYAERLNHNDPKKRINAIQGLLSKGVNAADKTKFIGLIITKFVDENQQVRYEARKAADKLATKKQIMDGNLSALTSTDRYVYSDAVKALGYLNDRKVIVTLHKLLKEGKYPNVIVEAFNKLRLKPSTLDEKKIWLAMKTYTFLETGDLINLLQDKDPMLRSEIIEELRRRGDKIAITPLLDLLADSSIYYDVVYALEELGTTKEQWKTGLLAANNEKSKSFLNLLETTQTELIFKLRQGDTFAARALVILGSVESLIKFFEDEVPSMDNMDYFYNVNVIKSIERTLGSSGNIRAIEPLKRRLRMLSPLAVFFKPTGFGETEVIHEPNPEIPVIKHALERLGASSAIEESLVQSSSPVSDEAVYEKSDEEKMEDKVYELAIQLSNNQDRWRYKAVDELGTLFSGKGESALKSLAVDFLIVRLNGRVGYSLNRLNKPKSIFWWTETNKDVLVKIVEVLGKLNDKRAFDPMLELLWRDDLENVKGTILNNLLKLSAEKEQKFNGYIKMLDAENFYLRQTAAFELGKLKDNRAFVLLNKHLEIEHDESVKDAINWALEELKSSSPMDDKVGGIDMNEIGLNRQEGSSAIEIQFDPAELQEIIDAGGIDGFAPVIINITPLPSVLPLLGLDPMKEEEREEVVRAQG